MKISIVIPTFKRSKLLIRCLDSIYRQTLPLDQYEVIVVSDGPDRETAKQIARWTKRKQVRLNFIQAPYKAGPAAARNLGWLSAKAPLVAFIDDDCIAREDWLNAYIKAYKGEDLAAFCGTTKVPLPVGPTDFEHNLAQLENAEFITANCACTKAALLAIGGFDQRFEMAWREDSDLHFKLINHHIRIKKVGDAIVIHPVKERPWGNSLKEQRKAQYEALLYKKFPTLYRQKIGNRYVYQFYFINFCWLLLIVTWYFHNPKGMLFTSAILALLIGIFAFRRIKPTAKTSRHIAEMLFTSILIPTLSCYWRLRGAFKYKTPFL